MNKPAPVPLFNYKKRPRQAIVSDPGKVLQSSHSLGGGDNAFNGGPAERTLNHSLGAPGPQTNQSAAGRFPPAPHRQAPGLMDMSGKINTPTGRMSTVVGRGQAQRTGGGNLGSSWGQSSTSGQGRPQGQWGDATTNFAQRNNKGLTGGNSNAAPASFTKNTSYNSINQTSGRGGNFGGSHMTSSGFNRGAKFGGNSFSSSRGGNTNVGGSRGAYNNNNSASHSSAGHSNQTQASSNSLSSSKFTFRAGSGSAQRGHAQSNGGFGSNAVSAGRGGIHPGRGRMQGGAVQNNQQGYNKGFASNQNTTFGNQETSIFDSDLQVQPEKPQPRQNANTKPVKRAVDDVSLRILTCRIAPLKAWLDQKLDVGTVMFEVYGILDSATVKDRTGTGKEFTLRDDTGSIKCIFYEIDRELARLTRGQVHRCVGIPDRARGLLKVVSVRPAEQQERQVCLAAEQWSQGEMEGIVGRWNEQ